MQTRKLYRPVGQAEYDLIKDTSFREFPPRLEFQPIFYPVTNQEYAEKIAKDWNTKDPASGFVGYVLEFDIEETYISQFPIQQVGSQLCTEYWIPAEELSNFNSKIIGEIRCVATFQADT